MHSAMWRKVSKQLLRCKVMRKYLKISKCVWPRTLKIMSLIWHELFFFLLFILMQDNGLSFHPIRYSLHFLFFFFLLSTTNQRNSRIHIDSLVWKRNRIYGWILCYGVRIFGLFCWLLAFQVNNINIHSEAL